MGSVIATVGKQEYHPQKVLTYVCVMIQLVRDTFAQTKVQIRPHVKVNNTDYI